MSAHTPYPFHEGGFQGRPKARGGRRGVQGGRGYYRQHEEIPRHEAWWEDNWFDNYREDPNVGQAYHVSPAPTVAGRLLLVELLEDTHLPPIVGHPIVAGRVRLKEDIGYNVFFTFLVLNEKWKKFPRIPSILHASC
ncbi:hypothetical protein M9H77_02415 [Catharanthus roseus]|uniref:Uncharacterized protein n=1 Tax=Catharanthus roseus TaxID=4058 RepID=A0ACC0C886_CATRO|nr:hypothetical protein M9H77_02415 [Catharanthus roseus]